MTPDLIIAVINGPQGCGKDTIAGRLAREPFIIIGNRHVKFWQEKMITPIRDCLKEITGIDDYNFEVHKDEPILYNKMTPRDAVIRIDRHLRAIFGKEYLAHLMIKSINKGVARAKHFLYDDPVQVFLVDAGVAAEVMALQEEYKEKLKVIRIYRKGCEFKDLRGYLAAADGTVHNNATINDAVQAVMQYVDKWIKELGYDRVSTRTPSGVSKAS